jgi:phage FluMu gp28-like protein
LTLSPQDIQKVIAEIESSFLPYQLRWIYDRTRFRAVEKAVRCGITYAHSYQASKKRVFRDPSLKPIREIFASKNRVTASEYTSYHRKWAEAWNQIIPGLIDLSTWTTEVCRYPGGDILIVSSDPDAFRGMEGDVSLDEFCFHDQQESLFSAAQSRIQWLPDGQVSLISSHSHPDTTFARLVSEWRRSRDGQHSVHSTTIHDAVRQGLARKVWAHRLHEFKSGEALDAAFIKSVRDTCLSEEDFEREYCCRPAALSAMVRDDVYDRNAVEKVPDTLEPRRYRPLFVGIDCGRSKDSTVAWVLERYDDKYGVSCYRTVCVKVVERLPFPQQHAILLPILTHGDVEHGYIDQGAQGRALADSVKDETGNVIEPLGMGQKNKGEMAELLRAFAQSDRISFPKDDAKCKQSILSVRRRLVNPNTGNLSYEGGTSFDHGDFFWAAALSLYAAERDSLAGFHHSLPQGDAA